jgi:hypothetical protein
MSNTSSMSSLDTFASWVSNYKTWPELKAWLQAEEPGIDIIESEDSAYAILRNSKEKEGEAAIAEDAVSEAGQLCRSVVWDTEANLPCCVSPFAARRDQKIPNSGATDPGLRIEDFVEGVMVNVFRARGDAETHVTTRSKLDADGTFYSERSFRELFEEAMDAKHTSLNEIEKLIGAPSDSVAATFITLVLAHPEHRVVRTVEKANFWAIYRGTVANDGTVTFYTEDLPVAWRPKTYSLTFKGEFADLKAKFDEIKATKPWYWQGLVVHSGLQRWRFRNSEHDRVRRDLRGTESNSYGRFLRLRSQKRVQEYLRIYQEDNADFQVYEQDFRSATKMLYAWYCKCHKEHSVVFKSLPKSVQPLVFDLHKFYLTALRPANKSLHMAEVITWIPQHLKTQYGISNFVRFSGEKEQPTSVATGSATTATTRHITTSGDTLQVTVDVSESADVTGATAPVSPTGDTVPVVEAV